MRERRSVIIQEKGRGAAVPLTSADIAEILASLHCRHTHRSQLVMEKLTKGLKATWGHVPVVPECTDGPSSRS